MFNSFGLFLFGGFTANIQTLIVHQYNIINQHETDGWTIGLHRSTRFLRPNLGRVRIIVSVGVLSPGQVHHIQVYRFSVDKYFFDRVQDFGPVKNPRLSYNCSRHRLLVFGQIRIRRKLEADWLVFGAQWAATGSLCEFESSSTSAERKQDCWSTNKQTKKPNSICSPTVQCWYSTSCPVHLRVNFKLFFRTQAEC